MYAHCIIGHQMHQMQIMIILMKPQSPYSRPPRPHSSWSSPWNINSHYLSCHWQISCPSGLSNEISTPYPTYRSNKNHMCQIRCSYQYPIKCNTSVLLEKSLSWGYRCPGQNLLNSFSFHVVSRAKLSEFI